MAKWLRGHATTYIERGFARRRGVAQSAMAPQLPQGDLWPVSNRACLEPALLAGGWAVMRTIG